MNIIWWTAICLGFLYGGITILGGLMQFKQRRIPVWCATGMILAGLLILTSVIISDFFIMISGLLLLHILAIYNGIYIHGKINVLHLIVRFIFSILIIGLTFIST